MSGSRPDPIPTGALTAAEQEQLRAQARTTVAALAQHPPHSPEFRRLVAATGALGEQAQARAAAVGHRTLPDSPSWGPALQELRRVVTALRPARPPWWKRLRGHQPAPITPAVYAQAAAEAGPLLEAVYRSQDGLARQRLALEGTLRQLEEGQEHLRRALFLAAELELLLEASLPELDTRQPLHAAAVREEVLYAVHSRRSDLTEALAAAVQAGLALELTLQQTAQLHAGLGEAAAGVVTALKLARQASQAAELRAQATQASQQLSWAGHHLETASSPDDLNAALAQVYAALDDLEQVERQARQP